MLKRSNICAMRRKLAGWTAAILITYFDTRPTKNTTIAIITQKYDNIFIFYTSSLNKIYPKKTLLSNYSIEIRVLI